MKNKFYCWREVETQNGAESQYLDADGTIVSDSSDRAYFESETEAQAHCDRYGELGEVEFSVQSCMVRD